MAKKRVQLTISGHVQGVYFRANTRDRAKRLGLTGWVKNLADGDVKLVAEGEENALKELVTWCHKGPPMARVNQVEEDWKDPEDEFDSFRIKY